MTTQQYVNFTSASTGVNFLSSNPKLFIKNIDQTCELTNITGFVNGFYFGLYQDYVIKINEIEYASVFEGCTVSDFQRSNVGYPRFNAYVSENKFGKVFSDQRGDYYMIGEGHTEGYGFMIYSVDIYTKEKGLYLIAQSVMNKSKLMEETK